MECVFFAKKFRSPRIMIRIAKVCIIPIIECGSIVWNQYRITAMNKIDRVLHRITLTALSKPFRHDDLRHMNNEERMNILKLLTLKILLTLQILNNFILTEQRSRILNCFHDTVQITRSPNIFNLPRRGLYLMMENLNTYRQHFDIRSLIPVAKRRLIAFFLEKQFEEI